MIIDVDTTFKVLSSLEEQLLLATVEKEAHLKFILMTLTKGLFSLEEYLRMFKSMYNNLSTSSVRNRKLWKGWRDSKGGVNRNEKALTL